MMFNSVSYRGSFRRTTTGSPSKTKLMIWISSPVSTVRKVSLRGLTHQAIHILGRSLDPKRLVPIDAFDPELSTEIDLYAETDQVAKLEDQPC